MKLRRSPDLTGKTFGERTVLRFSHQEPKSRNYFWVVKCSCGREDKVAGTNLKRGIGKQCPECSGRSNGRTGLYSQSKDLPVYFIKCGDYIKIGVSADIPRRLKDLKVSNPYDCELIKVDTEMSEEYWHNKFKDRHHRGEWYLIDTCELVDIG